MLTLFRKELRLAADVLAGAIVLLAASFPLALAGVYMQGVRPIPWASVVSAGCILNQYTMVLTGALIGAVLFSRDRESCSEYFLAYLPISRLRQFGAKALGGIVLWLSLWSINLLILIVCVWAVGRGWEPVAPFVPRILGIAALSFAAWGVTSLAACYVSSVTGAAFAGMVAVVAAVMGRYLWIGAVTNGDLFGMSFQLSLAAWGIAGIVLSWPAYARHRSMNGGYRPAALSVRSENRPLRHFRGRAGALVWKDARLLQSSLLMGMTLFFLPFVAATGYTFLSGEAAPGYRAASLIAMALGWLVLPLWSATSVADEWGSSSYRLVSQLPISTRQVLAAKLVVAAMPAVVVLAMPIAVFLLAQQCIEDDPAIHLLMSWDDFSTSHFLSGAIAYAGALPVAFAVAWFFAATLRRKILPMVLGVIAAPVAMAAWAVLGVPDGYFAARFLPLQMAVIHAIALGTICALLIIAGSRRMVRAGLA